MLPLSDGLPARRFPVVSILLIVANFGVFILYWCFAVLGFSGVAGVRG
jgi:hypothetical protein